MSQQDQSKYSNEYESKTIENVPMSLNNINNLLSASDLNINNISPKDSNNILNNNFLEITSISNNNKLDNSDKNTISSNFSNVLKNISELNINSCIILFHKELFVSKFSNSINNNENYFKENHKKILNILRNDINSTNANNLSDILKIFNESIKKVVEIQIKKIKNDIDEYKSKLLFVEQSNRYLIRQNFLKQTKIDILENEIDSYIEMEEEFDEMKEKLKYENGKFLHNEKKENEILILRAENSKLKKIVDKNEKTIEEKNNIIESIKKKSSSMFNINNNSIKNSFELNDIDNNSNPILANYQSYNALQKYKSPKHDVSGYKTNNYSQRPNNKNIHYMENKVYQNSKKNIFSSRVNTKELINNRIKNKVINMKKIHRINNESGLGLYNNKSAAQITNSLLSNNRIDSSNKRIKKNINSYLKKSNIFNAHAPCRLQKKINSGLINSNNNNIINLIKNNNNKIIVNSILDNSINNISNNNIYNNNSFLFRTMRKKFISSKKAYKSNLKHTKDEYVIIRNNNSLMKSPNTFNNNDFENSLAVKNNNIIINNIIQNSTSMPVSGATSKSKEKKNISENELSRVKNNYFKQQQQPLYSAYIHKRDNHKNLKQKSSEVLSVNIRKKNE